MRGWVCAMRLLQDEDASVSSPIARALPVALALPRGADAGGGCVDGCGRADGFGSGGVSVEVLGSHGTGDEGGLLVGGGLYAPLALMKAVRGVVSFVVRALMFFCPLFLLMNSADVSCRAAGAVRPVPCVSCRVAVA